jgi:hypothetical protein
VKAFLDLLVLVSFDFDNLNVIGDFNFDILLDPEHSATPVSIVAFLTLCVFRFFRYHPSSQGLLLARATTTF